MTRTNESTTIPSRDSVTRGLHALLAGGFVFGCSVEADDLDTGSQPLEAAENDSAPQSAAAARLTTEGPDIPAPVEDLARALLRAEVRESGYVLHYQPLQDRDGLVRYRVRQAPIEITETEARPGMFAASLDLEYDRYTQQAFVCEHDTCQLGELAVRETATGASMWDTDVPLTASPDATALTITAVRFFEHTSYNGQPYSFTVSVDLTGVFEFNLPNLVVIGQDDTWSSFWNHNGICPSCVVGGNQVIIYDLEVWKHGGFSGKDYFFGGTDYDGNFNNNHWGWLSGDINDKISSTEFKVSVFPAGPHCGDGSCAGSETVANCSADCPAVCGDDICSPGETPNNCGADCCVPSGCGPLDCGSTTNGCGAWIWCGPCEDDCEAGACEDGSCCPPSGLCSDGSFCFV